MALVDIFFSRHENITFIDKESAQERQRQLSDYCRVFNSFCSLVRDDIDNQFPGLARDGIGFSGGMVKSISKTISREMGMIILFQPKGIYADDYVSGLIDWMQIPSDKMSNEEVDIFIKLRLSFIELFFRKLEKFIEDVISQLPDSISCKDHAKAIEEWMFEVNSRFRDRNIPFQYHDGILHPSNDELISETIEEPFWEAVLGLGWTQTVQHMKEAVDQQISNPSFSASQAQLALESVLKEFFGGDGGNIPPKTSNLCKKRIISKHEKFMIDEFFKKVRHPSSHSKNASDSGSPVTRSHSEASWIIGFSMYTIKRIIDGSNLEAMSNKT